MCINFLMFFILSSLSSLCFFSSFFFSFLFVSALLSLSLSALLSLPQSQVNSSVEVEVVVGCQRLGGGGCGLVVFSDGLFPDLLVMVVRDGDGDSVWVCRR